MGYVHTGRGVEGVNMSVVVNGLFADRQAEHCAKLTSDQYVLSKWDLQLMWKLFAGRNHHMKKTE